MGPFDTVINCRAVEGSGEPTGITLNHLDVPTGKGAIAALSRDRRTLTGVKVRVAILPWWRQGLHNTFATLLSTVPGFETRIIRDLVHYDGNIYN